jgi:hypothetical protein
LELGQLMEVNVTTSNNVISVLELDGRGGRKDEKL